MRVEDTGSGDCPVDELLGNSSGDKGLGQQMIPITVDSIIFTSFFHPHPLYPPQKGLFQARKTTFIVSYQYPHPL